MANGDWPNITVKSKPAKKRGGAGTYRTWVAEAKTRMPCGQQFKETARSDNESVARDQAHDTVKSKGNRHYWSCGRCS